MQETRIQSEGLEDPLEKEMAAHSSIAWRIPWTEGAWQATVHGVARVRYDLVTKPAPPIMYQSIKFNPFLDGSQLPPLSHYTATPKSLTLLFFYTFQNFDKYS